ncbi:flagellar hook-associated protein FlgL [Legionella drancourtii]|uniref:Flagellar hook-associated protein FlgL n=1 Tax=Legionella drancourtii LLAP12 TaxID=658187 RepID=G9EKC9_9GAMM|nr:flagellar hook-associated protein FlgL [Legionella drancourtii]EHL32280.1 flagellar hook-associated protein FlgL [Legionella drancourtii LLAP12]
MRISTNQVYQNGLSNLLLQQERVTKLQGQLASGIKVQFASDDPISYAQIEWMSQRVSTTELLQKNCMNASNALNLEEAVLTDCTNNLQRLREIQVQASNGTLSQTQRQALSVEVTDILNQLQGFANTKDNDGDYLFAGGQTATEPFTLNSSGQYTYNGDSTQRFQLIAGSLQIAINDPGDGIFMRIPGGNGTFSVSATATNTGTGSVSTGSVTNSAAYVADDYTISFALNTAGSLVAMVTGAASGNVIPSSGLPDDAPVYQEGMALSFNGMSMQVSGMPEPGDTFSVTPAQNVSLFSTIQDMITNLNLPFGTAVEKAATVTENNQLLAQLDNALDSIIETVSNIGSRLNQVSNSQDSNEDLIETSEITLKFLRETDPAAVATEFNLQLVNLQAAQQSFVRVQGLSVFNYI